MAEKVRVLIVEDQGIIARALELKLDRLGYEVAGVSASGRDAIARIEQSCPDAILMDVIIKGDLDGVETAREVRRRFAIPVIYLTAHSDPKTLGRALETDPYGYLVKPYDEDQLRQVIISALRLHTYKTLAASREQLLVNVLDRVSEAVIALDQRGSITFFNPPAEALTGSKAADAVGAEWSKVFEIRNGGGESPADFAEALQKGEATSLDNWTLAAQGSTRRIRGAAAPLRDLRGCVGGAVLVLQRV